MNRFYLWLKVFFHDPNDEALAELLDTSEDGKVYRDYIDGFIKKESK